ncbi:hypothetical protein CAP35_09730 [Chitinophagaceae bacterium IBVUCB1]|nr:hypothetical protein CAP35_09730 [Chitinophagaceae bacterium IBVUCB1]
MRKVTFISILVILLFVTGYVYWFYYNPYSEGSREGVLQKFSRKGNVFKTHEGEMIQLGFGQRGAAINSQYYYFSVDDPKVADSLQHCLGKIVRLHYVQYRKNLPWRGENYNKQNAEKGQYVVDRIEKVENATY